MPALTDPARLWVRGAGEAGARADARSLPEIVLDAVTRALADAGVTRDDVDYVVTAGLDLLDGKVASNVALVEVTGSVLRGEVRVASDGAAAVVHAAAVCGSGLHRTVLVVAACKSTESDPDVLSRWFHDPVLVQPLQVGDLEAAALQASAWIAAGGSPCDASALAASRCAASIEEVEQAPFACPPIRTSWRAPIADGAVALVLSVDRAADRRDHAVQLAGAGLCVEPHYLGDRDLVGCPALRRAAERALGQAGSSIEAIDAAEISAPFAHQEIVWRRALGLPDHTVTNASGGWFEGAGTPYVVAGLARVVRAYEVVAAGRARTALAHGAWGPAGQGHAVLVLCAGGQP